MDSNEYTLSMLTQLPNRKLQSFLHSVYFLRKDNFLYILLKNTVSYVDWFVKMEENHSLQFQWDTEVLQSLSCPGGGGGGEGYSLYKLYRYVLI